MGVLIARALRARWMVLYWITIHTPVHALGITCDGYRPVGGGMAQYCLRLRKHGGLCWSRIDAYGEYVPEGGWFRGLPR